MTDRELMQLAREAGFESNSLGVTYTSGWLQDLLERFAALVAAAEREGCAELTDEFFNTGRNWAQLAAAIRARGNHE